MWFILNQMTLTEDPNWPRAKAWLESNSSTPDIEVVGVLAHQTSISPTNAHLTPDAVREALQRYSTYNLSQDVDVQDLKVNDLGNITDVDFSDGEANVLKFISENHNPNALLIALGGDNSITYSVMQAKNKNDLSNAGLITFDAHFDLRDGVSNGSPVRRLIEAGLNPKRIVQIGIADFANSKTYAQRAKDLGITIIPRSEIHKSTIPEIIKNAISIAGANIYIDIDVDVCDRSVAPACPASVPGGITANQLRLIAREVAKYKQVKAIDFTEVDSSKDSADQRTTRLVALALLEIAAGRLRQYSA
jgi:formiminoglutamase